MLLRTPEILTERRTKPGCVQFAGHFVESPVGWSTKFSSVGFVGFISLLIVNTAAFGQPDIANSSQMEKIGASGQVELFGSVTVQDGQTVVKPKYIPHISQQVPSANEMLVSATQKSSAQKADQSRRPVPDTAAQNESLKRIKGIFADAYSDRSGKAALAALLLKTGLESSDSPTDQYVLLNEALAAAASVGDVDTTLKVIDAIGKKYQANSSDMLFGAFNELFKNVADPQSADRLLLAASYNLDELIGNDEYDDAKQLVGKMYLFAREKRLSSWQDRLKGRSKSVREFSKSFAALSEQFTTLQKNPDDDHANQLVGEFYCFTKTEFDNRLQHLTQGSNPETRTVAMIELSSDGSLDEQIAIADAWW